MKIIRNNTACYACRSCQLICSFHHTGEFQPSAGSIKVHRDYVDGNITWSIDSTCDGCQTEDEPLCVKFCTYNAITMPDGYVHTGKEETK